MITTLPQLIERLRAIPDDKWCVDLLTNFNGQHCVMGHVEQLGKEGEIPDHRSPWDFLASLGVEDYRLVDANNGDYDADNRDKSGAAVKRRAIEFLEGVQKQQTV